jgi:hypothetical protein
VIERQRERERERERETEREGGREGGKEKDRIIAESNVGKKLTLSPIRHACLLNFIAIPLHLSSPGALVLGSDYRREGMNNS